MANDGYRTCYLYIVKEEGHSALYKIGVALSIAERLRSLQTGNGRRLSVFCSFKFTKETAYQAETKMHEKFREHRAVGEWFAFDDMAILTAQEFATSLEASFNSGKWANFDPGQSNPKPHYKTKSSPRPIASPIYTGGKTPQWYVEKYQVSYEKALRMYRVDKNWDRKMAKKNAYYRR